MPDLRAWIRPRARTALELVAHPEQPRASQRLERFVGCESQVRRTQDEQVKLEGADDKSVTVQRVAHMRNLDALLPFRSRQISLPCSSRAGQLCLVYHITRPALDMKSPAADETAKRKQEIVRAAKA